MKLLAQLDGSEEKRAAVARIAVERQRCAEHERRSGLDRSPLGELERPLSDLAGARGRPGAERRNHRSSKQTGRRRPVGRLAARSAVEQQVACPRCRAAAREQVAEQQFGRSPRAPLVEFREGSLDMVDCCIDVASERGRLSRTDQPSRALGPCRAQARRELERARGRRMCVP